MNVSERTIFWHKLEEKKNDWTHVFWYIYFNSERKRWRERPNQVTPDTLWMECGNCPLKLYISISFLLSLGFCLILCSFHFDCRLMLLHNDAHFFLFLLPFISLSSYFRNQHHHPLTHSPHCSSQWIWLMRQRFNVSYIVEKEKNKNIAQTLALSSLFSLCIWVWVCIYERASINKGYCHYFFPLFEREFDT